MFGQIEKIVNDYKTVMKLCDHILDDLFKYEEDFAKDMINRTENETLKTLLARQYIQDTGTVFYSMELSLFNDIDGKSFSIGYTISDIEDEYNSVMYTRAMAINLLNFDDDQRTEAARKNLIKVQCIKGMEEGLSMSRIMGTITRDEQAEGLKLFQPIKDGIAKDATNSKSVMASR